MRSVKLGTGTAYWGDTLLPARDMVERADIEYLCCDHLAELTMSILAKNKRRNPERGFTSDLIPLLRSVLPTARERGIRIISDGGGANPHAAGRAAVQLCHELGLTGLRIAVVDGDDVADRIDELMGQGIAFENLDTGEPLSVVRDRLTHANVYMGTDGIIEALERGADVVITGRVTDPALFLAPMRHELGWAADDWHRLGAGTGVAHVMECGGQATGGLYAGGWQKVERKHEIGYPVGEVFENGEAVISKTPGSGGEVSPGTLSEQLVYEMHDPANYLTADVVADVTDIAFTEVGPDRVRVAGVTGKERPETLKVNMGYEAGYIGEALFTFTWPDAYAKSVGGIEFLEDRLRMAGFEADDVRIEYIGRTSMFGPGLVPEPDDPEELEVAVRYAARCRTAEQAAKVYRESVSLFNNGPAGASGIGFAPPTKQLLAAWPTLIPREAVAAGVTMLEV
jgi:hypothetical protein